LSESAQSQSGLSLSDFCGGRACLRCKKRDGSFWLPPNCAVFEATGSQGVSVRGFHLCRWIMNLAFEVKSRFFESPKFRGIFFYSGKGCVKTQHNRFSLRRRSGKRLKMFLEFILVWELKWRVQHSFLESRRGSRGWSTPLPDRVQAGWTTRVSASFVWRIRPRLRCVPVGTYVCARHAVRKRSRMMATSVRTDQSRLS